MKYLIIPKFIVTNDLNDSVLKNYAIEITDGIINSLIDLNKSEIKNYPGEIFHYPELTLIPGFVQTHIHLCQTLFRGLADDLQLLDWLQYRIFPYENAHDKNSLSASVKVGINELLRGGTTTILDMGTLRHQEIIFDELINSGIRAFAGNCLIDQNDLFPQFKSSTKEQIDYTYSLAKEFHNKADGRIKFGFAPRFVLSCSEELLKESFQMKNEFAGSVYHTHSSENKNEIAEVRKKFGKENIEYFHSINTIDDHSVFAHCIHTSENEIEIMKQTKMRVAHCPSSNLKLASGIANIPRYLKEGISVSLGADGAPCNNNLSAFTEMRLAALIQKPIYGADVMDAKTVFKLATIEGAKALHLENEIGSIEIGKKADLVLLDLNLFNNSYLENENSIYSDIVYSSGLNNVHSVIVDGKWLVKDFKSLVYDENEITENAKSELQKLLGRV
ncbi:amidohydrolase family protein [Ignavibacterium sp.]|uniref:amidohydrolase family protein n=1 Tax=Ignavibacterium sp. TaxID=2651167 RepID=UPI002201E76B|nr:amidohydrolase family protein [Ignavibacterium sp.]BDQ02667.1 MAG: 5-methylthioadenosine/S-adenosylhomocysteine deaminase [Ignavibacterium sp.]